MGDNESLRKIGKTYYKNLDLAKTTGALVDMLMHSKVEKEDLSTAQDMVNHLFIN